MKILGKKIRKKTIKRAIMITFAVTMIIGLLGTAMLPFISTL